MSSMVLWEYEYIKIILILALEVGKQQGNILVLAQNMDIKTSCCIL